MNHGACRDESNVRACFRPARRAILAAPSALCAPSYDDALTIIVPAMWNGLDQNISLLYNAKKKKKGYLQTLAVRSCDHFGTHSAVGWIDQQTIALVYVLILEWKILSSMCIKVMDEGRKPKLSVFCICLSVRPSSYLSIHHPSFIHPSIIYQSIIPPSLIYLSVCLSIRLSVRAN